jgi:hypothetical protein
MMASPWRSAGGQRRSGSSHIDPATGRNKRESAKLAKRSARSGGAGNQIKQRNGKPTERRIDQKRRNNTARKGWW